MPADIGRNLFSSLLMIGTLFSHLGEKSRRGTQCLTCFPFCLEAHGIDDIKVRLISISNYLMVKILDLFFDSFLFFIVSSQVVFLCHCRQAFCQIHFAVPDRMKNVKVLISCVSLLELQNIFG